MPRDTFKQELRRKSRTEMFADLLEQLFKVITDLGVEPAAVVEIVQQRIRERAVQQREAKERASERWAAQVTQRAKDSFERFSKGGMPTEKGRPTPVRTRTR